uniref:peptidylprolyl isomerase n=1 Tax=Kwoniella bestiolae CBS 10118 TaxID=1296100 RepID=A0A1B9FSM9_9TREE|nr:FK506-binding protein 1 [Kwoniella bestiolae CBS 10118]OCF21778.1 FK506-binding protein 1 [Kwoniella bestiolae CBS 10118]
MGVTIETISPGDGKNFPKPGQMVAIPYVGTLADGTEFDSSRQRGQPVRIQVIKGWDQGVVKLSLGQKANLICTPDFAYGENGHPPVIPRNATLKFKGE